MTSTLTIDLLAESELLFRSSRRRGNLLETLRHVPGGALSGALAHRWIDAGRPVDASFRALFQDGTVRWTHGRPLVEGASAHPAPLSLRTDKQQPYGDGTVLDTLLGGGAAPEGRTERVKGDVTLDGWVRPGGQPLSMRTRIGTFDDDGTGVDPARAAGARDGLAHTGQLFTEVTLPVGTRFRSTVEGPGELLDELVGLVTRDGDLLRLGRARTVAGHAAVTWGGPTEVTPHGPSDGAVHTLTALSDLVLLDGFQRAVTVLDREALAAVLGVDTQDVEVVRSLERTTVVGAWDGLNRMPGPFDTAVRAGSCVAFTAPGDAVAALAADPWVGWRNGEGHGHVAVDAPWHREGTTWRIVSPTEVGIADSGDGVDLAERAHELASALRRELRGDLTPSLWAQVESAVRAGRELRVPEDGPDVGAQQASGRGATSGGRRRAARRAIVQQLTAAFGDGIDSHERRVELVEEVGREVRLATRDADVLRRRRTEAGGAAAAERMES